MMVFIIGSLIGLVLGLTGAGGSVLAVPLLTYGLSLSMTDAAGLSLGAVAVAAGMGTFMRLRSGLIHWVPAILFAVSGAAFVPLGQWLNKQVPENLLLLAFSVLAFFVAWRMWMSAQRSPEYTQFVRATAASAERLSQPACPLSESGRFEFKLPCFLRLLSGGILAGILAGLFGVGGGFVIVPTLVLLIQISMFEAITTSLFVITMIASVGFINFSLHHQMEFSFITFLIGGSVCGMLLGTLLAKRVAGPVLQKGFAALMAITALLMVGNSLFRF